VLEEGIEALAHAHKLFICLCLQQNTNWMEGTEYRLHAICLGLRLGLRLTQDGGWLNVSSGTGSPGSPGQRAVKRLMCL